MRRPSVLEYITAAFLAVGSLLILGLLIVHPAHADNRQADPSVQITIAQADQIIGTCSGSVVNTSYGRGVLTAGHCAEGDAYEMIDEFGAKAKIVPVYVDHIHDVAFMKIVGQSNIGAYDLSCHAVLTVGEHIHMTGYPLDLGRLSVDGTIVSVQQPVAMWPAAAMADMMAGAGNSGSAVRDDSGKVVGVLTGGLGSFGDLSIVVPVSVFCNAGLAE